MPFIVWTDHKNLSYIQSAKRLNSRQARWALFFGHFKFSLSYRPGSLSTKPDVGLEDRVLGDPGPGSPGRSGYWPSRSVVRPGCSSFGRSVVWSFVKAGLSSRDHPHPGFPAPPFLVAYHGPRHPVFRRRMCHLCTQQDIQQTSVWTASPAAYPQSSVVQHRS